MQYLSRWFLYNTIAYGSAIRSELRKGNQSTKVLSLRLWWSYAVLLLPRACARLSGLFFGFLLYAQSDVQIVASRRDSPPLQRRLYLLFAMVVSFFLPLFWVVELLSYEIGARYVQRNYVRYKRRIAVMRLLSSLISALDARVQRYCSELSRLVQILDDFPLWPLIVVVSAVDILSGSYVPVVCFGLIAWVGVLCAYSTGRLSRIMERWVVHFMEYSRPALLWSRGGMMRVYAVYTAICSGSVGMKRLAFYLRYAYFSVPPDKSWATGFLFRWLLPAKMYHYIRDYHHNLYYMVLYSHVLRNFSQPDWSQYGNTMDELWSNFCDDIRSVSQGSVFNRWVPLITGCNSQSNLFSSQIEDFPQKRLKDNLSSILICDDMERMYQSKVKEQLTHYQTLQDTTLKDSLDMVVSSWKNEDLVLDVKAKVEWRTTLDKLVHLLRTHGQNDERQVLINTWVDLASSSPTCGVGVAIQTMEPVRQGAVCLGNDPLAEFEQIIRGRWHQDERCFSQALRDSILKNDSPKSWLRTLKDISQRHPHFFGNDEHFLSLAFVRTSLLSWYRDVRWLNNNIAVDELSTHWYALYDVYFGDNVGILSALHSRFITTASRHQVLNWRSFRACQGHFLVNSKKPFSRSLIVEKECYRNFSMLIDQFFKNRGFNPTDMDWSTCYKKWLSSDDMDNLQARGEKESLSIKAVILAIVQDPTYAEREEDKLHALRERLIEPWLAMFLLERGLACPLPTGSLKACRKVEQLHGTLSMSSLRLFQRSLFGMRRWLLHMWYSYDRRYWSRRRFYLKKGAGLVLQAAQSSTFSGCFPKGFNCFSLFSSAVGRSAEKKMKVGSISPLY